ncbi:MAG: biotin--[acetyl-CoA-carboxylase] ligase [Bacteroidetes bacterium]|nr:biotin--[acetyl-CoA-carboxylase] ligase [Bacteroidota bacterium]
MPKTIHLATVDSTNNYAMRLIDTASAVHGDLIWADRQEAGRGQRGKDWADQAGQSLLMSLILAPGLALNEQPLFLATVAMAVLEWLRSLLPPGTACAIKWPNDILIEDKKAVGILIENVVHGHDWQWAIVGIGINLGQRHFPESLPRATSLWLNSSGLISPEQAAPELHEFLLERLHRSPAEVWEAYNRNLFRRGEWQLFSCKGEQIKMLVQAVDTDGRLCLQHESGHLERYYHGNLDWVWD